MKSGNPTVKHSKAPVSPKKSQKYLPLIMEQFFQQLAWQ